MTAYFLRTAKWIRICKFVMWYLMVIFVIENLLVFLHIHGIVTFLPAPVISINVDARTELNSSFSGKVRGNASISKSIRNQTSSQSKPQILDLHTIQDPQVVYRNRSRPLSVQKNMKINIKYDSPHHTNKTASILGRPIRVIPTNDPVLEKKYFMKQPTKVNPFIYDIVMQPKHICDEDTFMIILVHSFHPYTDKRMAIRETWGRLARGMPWPNKTVSDKINLVFMLGTHKLQGFNDKVRDEMEVYGDIVQGNFIDDYKNMTLKSLLGLKLVADHCQHVKFMLKSDDDMIINLPYLLQLLHEKHYNWTMMGPINRGSRVYRSGKWKLSREQYPFYTFPEYEAGSAYVFTTDLVKPLFDTAEYVPSFHIDDVYITGVLGKILNATHEVRRGFAYWTDKAPKSCDILENSKISGTKMSPNKLRFLWNQIEKGECIHTTTKRDGASNSKPKLL